MSTLAAGNTLAAAFCPREGNTPPDAILAPNDVTAAVGAAYGTVPVDGHRAAATWAPSAQTVATSATAQR